MASSHPYRTLAAESIADKELQKSLYALFPRFGRGAAQAYRELPEGPQLRLTAHRMRRQAIDNLDGLLETLTRNIRRRGGHVHFAPDAQEAVRQCVAIARRNNVKLAVKGKSMVSEEIDLNRGLEEAGIEVVETDLGEYIVQQAGEHPSHIIAPAIHLNRYDIGQLFHEKLGIPYSDDPPTLTREARKALRAKFLAADMGISGCNLACAETGHITTVSNEGNIRMASTLPRVHVVLMGMERIAAGIEDFDILLRLLVRGSTAHHMPTYVSHIGGPRLPDQMDGPEEFHLVILDNGRSKILADEIFREMLCCIRCAACLNVCPVYLKIGGHAYGFAYSGPVGAVVTPLLTGINHAKDLCLGETLCGACQNACPVNIDIPRMLLELRAKLATGDPRWGVTPNNPTEGILFDVWSRLVQHPALFAASLRLAALGQKLLPRQAGMIKRLPPPFNGWTMNRDLKPLAGLSFRARWQKRRMQS